MLQQPKVSVVIPTYNRADKILRCLDSVLKQTLPAHEIIVVDDCSGDNTAALVRGLAEPRIRYTALERNSGAQAARNRGILEATGGWIAFLDSDDEWLPDKLEMQLDALRQVAFDLMTVVHGDCWRYDPETQHRELWSVPALEGEGALVPLLKSPGPLFPAILTSKRALERIALLDERVPSYQEWDTSIRLAKECRFIHIREPLFVYHLHAGETLSKDKSRDIQGYQYIVDKFRQEIVDHCGVGALSAHLRKNALRAMRWGLFDEASGILVRTAEHTFEVRLLKMFARARRDPGSYWERWRRIKSLFSVGNDNIR